jgi:hypothetical protein
VVLQDEEIPVTSKYFKSLKKAYITPAMTVGQLKEQIAGALGCRYTELRLGEADRKPVTWLPDDTRMHTIKEDLSSIKILVERVSRRTRALPRLATRFDRFQQARY